MSDDDDESGQKKAGDTPPDLRTYGHLNKMTEQMYLHLDEVRGKLAEKAQDTDRKVMFALIMCAFIVLTQGVEIYWDIFKLGRWRTSGREIQTEILKRIRAHDGIFEPEP